MNWVSIITINALQYLLSTHPIILVLEIATWRILYWWSLCSNSFVSHIQGIQLNWEHCCLWNYAFYSFSSMEMSLKLSTHFSALMLFQPSFFLFLLLLLEAFTNRQVRGLRNFYSACVQTDPKIIGSFQGHDNPGEQWIFDLFAWSRMIYYSIVCPE